MSHFDEQGGHCKIPRHLRRLSAKIERGAYRGKRKERKAELRFWRKANAYWRAS